MSTQIRNIHDAFFKQALGDPNAAGTFLHEHLPAELKKLLGPEPPEPVPGSFVDEDLRQHHSDLLFRVRLKAGTIAFAYVLMEHKSQPDPAARLQLLRYIVRLLTRWHEQSEKQLPLPTVLPLLVHQGPDKWDSSVEFADLFGTVPEPMQPYLPSFSHALVDLTNVADRLLSRQVRLRAFLKAVKYCRRDDLPDQLLVVLAEAPLLETGDLCVIVAYLDKGSSKIDNACMHGALQHLVPERTEQVMGGITQPYFEKGLAEGKAAGIAEGKAALLCRLLEKRFGPLSPPVRQRIQTADPTSIEMWFDRGFDAPDLQSVFASN